MSRGSSITRMIIPILALTMVMGFSIVSSGASMGVIDEIQLPVGSVINISYMGDTAYALGSDHYIYRLEDGTPVKLDWLGGNITKLESVPHPTWPALIFYRGLYEVGLLYGNPQNPSAWSVSTYTPVVYAAYDPAYNIFLAVDVEGNLYRASPGSELIPVLGPRGVANDVLDTIYVHLNRTTYNIFSAMNTTNLTYVGLADYTFKVTGLYPLVEYTYQHMTEGLVPAFVSMAFNTTITVVNETTNETLNISLPEFTLYIAMYPLTTPLLDPIYAVNTSFLGFYQVNGTIYTIEKSVWQNETNITMYELLYNTTHYDVAPTSNPITMPDPNAEPLIAYKSSNGQPLLLVIMRSTVYAYQPTIYNDTLLWSAQPLLGSTIEGYTISRDAIVFFNQTMAQSLSTDGGTPLWNMYNGIHLEHPVHVASSTWAGYTAFGTQDGFLYMVNAPTGSPVSKVTVHTCVNGVCLGGFNVSVTSSQGSYQATTGDNGTAIFYLVNGLWTFKADAPYLGETTRVAEIGPGGVNVYLNYTLFTSSVTLIYQQDPLGFLSTLEPRGTAEIEVNGYTLQLQVNGTQIIVENPPGILAPIWTGNQYILLPQGTWNLTVNVQYYNPVSVILNPPITSNKTLILYPELYNLSITPVDNLGSPAEIELILTHTGIGSSVSIPVDSPVTVEVPIGTYSILVSSTWYYPVNTTASIPGTDTVTLYLTRTNYTLILNLNDPELETLLGSVTVSITGTLNTSLSIEEGVASILLPWGSYNILVSGEYYEQLSLPVEVLDDTVLNVTLEPTTMEVDVVVYDTYTLRPIHSTVTLVYSMPGKQTLSYQFQINGTSTLTIRKLNYTAIFTAPQYVSKTLQLTTVDTEVYVGLDRVNYTLTLLIADELTGAQVSAPVVVELYNIESGRTHVYNLVNGTLTTSLPWGTYTMTVRSTLYLEKNLSFQVSGDTSLTVTLERVMVNLTLHVYDAETGENLNFQAYIARAGQDMVNETITGNGYASISIPWGTYTITVQAASYHASTINLSLTNDTTVDVPLNVIRVPLTIIITDKDTGEHLTAQVSIKGPENTTIYVQGRTTIYLKPGTYNVSISHIEGYKPESTLVTVLEGEGTQVSFQLEKIRYNVSISVSDEQGEPITNVNITIDGPVTIENVPPGTFLLPPGHYIITAHAPGFENKTIEVDLTSSADINIVLEQVQQEGGGRGIAIIGVLLLIAVIGIAIYLVVSNMKKTTSEEEILAGLPEE